MIPKRLVFLLRRGPPRARWQAWAGLILAGGAALWLVGMILVYLWRLILASLILAAGVYLVRRALRESSRSP